MDQYAADDRPSRNMRWLLGAVAAGLILVFLIAFWLKPDPRGFGTHQQLGLPACQFRMFTGVRCPHCGMTTSFANVVRGNFRAAAEANVMGIPLSATWALCIPWCLLSSVSGRWIGTRHPMQWLVFGSIVYLVLALLLWGIRIIANM